MKETDRLCVLRRLKKKEITQVEAAENLGISRRQIVRIYNNFKQYDVQGIMRKKSGGNRTFNEDFKAEVMAIVRRDYPDFSATLASEKLLERNSLHINRETLRQWMVEAGLRKTKKRKAARVHQSRARRSHSGEMIQIDGSIHNWFEGRGPKCCLLVFIDDATSCLMALKFFPSETTLAYFEILRSYIEQYGRPLSFYSDKDSVFVVNRPELVDKEKGETQFQRVLKGLDIQLICANSPQAKGRVERANKTLQDRLIKEMRLRGISNINDANAYLPQFIKSHNERFARAPEKIADYHRPLIMDNQQLNRLFSIQEVRTTTKNLEISYKNVIYKIKVAGIGYGLRYKKVIVHEYTNEMVEIYDNQRKLPYEIIAKTRNTAVIADSKEVNHIVDQLVSNAEDCGNMENSSSLRTFPQLQQQPPLLSAV